MNHTFLNSGGTSFSSETMIDIETDTKLSLSESC